ncbi:hypothetical protein MAPG_10391 [Magnaporthiopsis poae ATCC 64411]|uniref:Uncharacterized protein n=1 Tax=Magnaporthiopsis poae (strain ATCC 64411 / 73-15) TaxID=644358 RepID=A0A0C4ECG7_MAGP6|nr:hypothetical protein MAPG_10391 [Magnaporthiopsis poae ATCC 64411]
MQHTVMGLDSCGPLGEREEAQKKRWCNSRRARGGGTLETLLVANNMGRADSEVYPGGGRHSGYTERTYTLSPRPSVFAFFCFLLHFAAQQCCRLLHWTISTSSNTQHN